MTGLVDQVVELHRIASIHCAIDWQLDLQHHSVNACTAKQIYADLLKRVDVNITEASHDDIVQYLEDKGETPEDYI